MRIIMISVVFFTLCQGSSVSGEEQEHQTRFIMLSVQGESFVFGRDVRLEVSYRNDAKQPWVVPKPDESALVGLRYRPSGTDVHPGGYNFGYVQLATTVAPDGQAVTARVYPRGKPVSIDPGKMYGFVVRFERDWTGNVKPDLWTVWVVDLSLELESNHVEIPLRFTDDSVLACLEIARDPEASLSKRKWHAEYLQKIMPELKLPWWRGWPHEPSADEQQQMEGQIQQELERFETFWKDKANRPAITAAIARINHEAGLDIEQRQYIERRGREKSDIRR